jgi:hypothetical protein
MSFSCRFNAPTDIRISIKEMVSDPAISIRLIEKTIFPMKTNPTNKSPMQIVHASKLATPSVCMSRIKLTRFRKFEIWAAAIGSTLGTRDRAFG